MVGWLVGWVGGQWDHMMEQPLLPVRGSPCTQTFTVQLKTRRCEHSDLWLTGLFKPQTSCGASDTQKHQLPLCASQLRSASSALTDDVYDHKHIFTQRTSFVNMCIKQLELNQRNVCAELIREEQN